MNAGEERKHIAYLLPHTDVTSEMDCAAMLPGYVLHVERMWLDSVSEKAEQHMVEEEFPRALQYLKGVVPYHCAIFGCTSASAANGRAGMEALERQMSQVLDCPAITALGAVLRGIEARQAKSVAVFTPYTQEVNRFFRGNIVDIMTGYRAFSRLFVKSFPVLSKGFEIETEMSIHALDKNLRLVNVPVDYRDRPAGSQSKLNTYSDGARVLVTIFRLVKDYKPMAFFSVVSLVLIVAAAVLFVPVFFEYLDTGLVERFPTLIVAGFLAVGGLLTFCCGLILDTVIKKERQNFELWLNLFRTLEDRE